MAFGSEMQTTGFLKCLLCHHKGGSPAAHNFKPHLEKYHKKELNQHQEGKGRKRGAQGGQGQRHGQRQLGVER